MFLEDEVVNCWWCDILDYSYTLIISTGLWFARPVLLEVLLTAFILLNLLRL